MKSSHDIIVYTDGGSRGNPGPAAIGVVAADRANHELFSFGERIGVKTNNEAEYAAVIFALQKLKARLGKLKTKKLAVEVRADSELLVRQLNHLYKLESETVIPLFVKVWNLMLDFKAVSFRHIPREQNRAADRLVNRALDRDERSLFES